MSVCPSCGGIVGRDCFNPEESAWITREMQRESVMAEARQMHYQHEADLHALQERLEHLEDRVKQMTEAVKRRGFDFVCVGTAAMELTRDFRPNIEYSGDPLFVALEADAGFTELDDHKAAIEEYGKWTCEKSSRTQS